MNLGSADEIKQEFVELLQRVIVRLKLLIFQLRWKGLTV